MKSKLKTENAESDIELCATSANVFRTKTENRNTVRISPRPFMLCLGREEIAYH